MGSFPSYAKSLAYIKDGYSHFLELPPPSTLKQQALVLPAFLSFYNVALFTLRSPCSLCGVLALCVVPRRWRLFQLRR